MEKTQSRSLQSTGKYCLQGLCSGLLYARSQAEMRSTWIKLQKWINVKCCPVERESAPVLQTTFFLLMLQQSLMSWREQNDSCCAETALLVGSPSFIGTEELQLLNLKIMKGKEDQKAIQKKQERVSNYLLQRLRFTNCVIRDNSIKSNLPNSLQN